MMDSMLNKVCDVCGRTYNTEEELFQCYREISDKVNWKWVSQHQTLSEPFIREFKDESDWDCISRCQNLSESFIREFKNKVSWYHVSRYQTLSEPFIKEFKDKLYWNRISYYQNLSESFIREFKDRVDWGWISVYQNLSESFIRKFNGKMGWHHISIYQTLSESFIREFENKVKWGCISRYQTLSESFISEFSDKIDVEVIRESKANHITVEQYAAKHKLRIDSEYLYAYRNHNKRGAGNFKSNSHYVKGTYYHDWHCDTNPMNENSYGFGIWPIGNTKIRVKLEDWGTAVFEDEDGKGRVWGFEVV